MSSNIGNELVSFHHFLVERLDRNESDLSPEEALDMWRAEHPLTEERDDATATLKKVLDEIAAGDEGVPFEDFEREFRKKKRLGIQAMTYDLMIVRQAVDDAQIIYDWLAPKSPTGAVQWFEAFVITVFSVKRDPFTSGLAPESQSCGREIRERFFRTRRGRPYRLLFMVTGNRIRILHVRGPGQPPLSPDEMRR